MTDKTTPRIGTETGASWNNQSKLQEPKHRGIILEPEHETEDLSAVRSLTPEEVDEAGAGNTEPEASEFEVIVYNKVFWCFRSTGSDNSEGVNQILSHLIPNTSGLNLMSL